MARNERPALLDERGQCRPCRILERARRRHDDHGDALDAVALTQHVHGQVRLPREHERGQCRPERKQRAGTGMGSVSRRGHENPDPLGRGRESFAGPGPPRARPRPPPPTRGWPSRRHRSARSGTRLARARTARRGAARAPANGPRTARRAVRECLVQAEPHPNPASSAREWSGDPDASPSASNGRPRRARRDRNPARCVAGPARPGPGASSTMARGVGAAVAS